MLSVVGPRLLLRSPLLLIEVLALEGHTALLVEVEEVVLVPRGTNAATRQGVEDLGLSGHWIPSLLATLEPLTVGEFSSRSSMCFSHQDTTRWRLAENNPEPTTKITTRQRGPHSQERPFGTMQSYCAHVQCVRLSAQLRFRGLRISVRSLQTVASQVTQSKLEPEHSTPLISENETIRRVFDDQLFWTNFSKPKSAASLGWVPSGILNMEHKTGLFQNPYLTSASGLRKFCKDSLEKAERLCESMVRDQSEAGLRNYVTNLDKLSDILCRVIDLAEFVRVAHPDKRFVNAAQECHEEMFEFMNKMNTNVELYQILAKVLTEPRISEQLTDEERQVGSILLADFEKSGINMDPETRDNFIELSQQIAIYGQHFANGTGQPANEYITAPVAELKDLERSLLNQLKMDLTRSNYKIPTWGHLPLSVLRSSTNEALRKRIWIELHSTSDNQVRTLETMLKYRGVLAHMLGKESFAAYQLEEKMAKKPEHVMNFLSRLAEETKPMAIAEVRALAELKQKQLGGHKELTSEEVAEFLKPWDRDHFAQLYTSNQRSSSHEAISSYFSLGSVMQGLSNLFKSIYGIQLIPENTKPGETWSSEVRRLNAVSESDGIIGVVYCDLFYRPGKTTAPAHFTVCCSRNIYADETEEDLKLIQTGSLPRTGERFQLPVISLVCGFETNRNIGKCLLSLSEVETLFHEMGHAMHSMLGRTTLHNTSGTRCATDFVELPSVLMEHFSRDPRVIQTFARHYMTDHPIPLQLLAQVQSENKFLQHSESYSQIKMALLDQLLHSDVVLSDNFDSTTLYHGLESKLRVFSDTESNWHGKFGHLFGYGSSYYAYLLDRAIASKVWEQLFVKDPFNRVNGEKLKQSVLKWGGSRDPWLCVADVLDQPAIATGDDKAMELIAQVDVDS